MLAGPWECEGMLHGIRGDGWRLAACASTNRWAHTRRQLRRRSLALASFACSRCAMILSVTRLRNASRCAPRALRASITLEEIAYSSPIVVQ